MEMKTMDSMNCPNIIPVWKTIARLMKKKADLLQIITRHLASPGGSIHKTVANVCIYIYTYRCLYAAIM